MRQAAALAALTAVVVFESAGIWAQTTKTYRARLSPVPIDVTMQQTIAGSGAVTATLTGTKLSITGTFDGLKSPATIAQVHRGQRGVRGPVAFDLVVTKNANGTGGTISGAVDLTSIQADDLSRERLYVQLHSEKAPDGNLWGWLLPQETKR
jgi:CHRD domain-containing protein